MKGTAKASVSCFIMLQLYLTLARTVESSVSEGWGAVATPIHGAVASLLLSIAELRLAYLAITNLQ